MYLPVQLDRQIFIRTVEVDNKRTYAVLSPESPTIEASVFQGFPERSFSRSQVLPQRPSLGRLSFSVV